MITGMGGLGEPIRQFYMEKNRTKRRQAIAKLIVINT